MLHFLAFFVGLYFALIAPDRMCKMLDAYRVGTTSYEMWRIVPLLFASAVLGVGLMFWSIGAIP